MQPLSQGKLAEGLTEELLKVIYKYDESLYVPTVLGVIEIVKHQVLQNQFHRDDDEDDY
jgi:hypothetical protein